MDKSEEVRWRVGMKRMAAVALGVTMALVALGAPALAKGGSGSIKAGPLGGTNSGGGTCPFYVTKLQVVGTPTFPLSTFTLAITVEDLGDSGTWYFPNPKLISGNPSQLIPEINIMEGSTMIDQAVPATSVALPDPSMTLGQSNTADYTFNVAPPLPGGSYTVSLVVGSGGHVFHMYNSSTVQSGSGSGTAPVCEPSTPPVGQLPEVPFAAGLPLLGIGMGAFVWYRRRHQPTPPAA